MFKINKSTIHQILNDPTCSKSNSEIYTGCHFGCSGTGSQTTPGDSCHFGCSGTGATGRGNNCHFGCSGCGGQ